MKTFPIQKQTLDRKGNVVSTETVQAQILPTPPGTCPDCGTVHAADQPHNANSLVYQYVFYGQHNRWPNWQDAMAHCTDEVKAQWTKALATKGIPVDGRHPDEKAAALEECMDRHRKRIADAGRDLHDEDS